MMDMRPSWIDNVDRWILFTNNRCNLHCEMCSSGCNRSIGTHPFQAMAWEVDVDDVALFLGHLRQLNKKQEIRLLGGETTMLPWKKLYLIINMIKTEGHSLSLLTNGFGLPIMDLEQLQKIDRIVLNDHGPNHQIIGECVDRLHDLGHTDFEVIRHKYHYNLEESAAHVQNKGKNCFQWLTLPAIYDRVLYPCCSMMQLKEGQRDSWMSLKRSGWHLDNPSLMTDIQDLSSLKPMIFQRCFNECYMPDIHLGTKIQLTSKPEDHPRRMK